MLRARLLPVLAAFALLPLVPSLAAPGDLDPSFGTGGKVDTGISFSFTYANAFAVQGDGKIIAAGYFNNGSYGDFALVRFNADGTFDSGFGTGGKVTTDFGDSAEVNSVAVQSDGKIVAAGYARVGSSAAVALARYNADGTLDTGFGSSGKLTNDVGSLTDKAYSVLVQSDGKVVVVGYSGFSEAFGGGTGDVIVVRYAADGTLDSGYGSGGKATSGTTSLDGPPFGALQSDGKIVVVRTGGFTVARLNTDGTPDTGFGSGGVVTNSSGGIPTCMALQSDGKILAAGVPSGQSDFALARFNTDGTIDSSFGSGGIVITDFAGNEDVPNSIAVQGDGKIVAVGSSYDSSSNAYVALARYTADGSLDSSFGSGGKVSTNLGASDAYGRAVAMQSDGRIVAGVQIDFTSSSVARFLGGDAGPVSPLLDPPVFDTLTVRTDGAAFLGFGSPAVDDGVVGGAAQVTIGGRKQTLIYGGAEGAALAQTGSLDPEGATFVALGDPVFGGEAIGFAGTALQTASSLPPLLRMDPRGVERAFSVRPGGRLAALYSQLTAVAGVKRLAAQAEPAPGGGQFARFRGFGLPRTRGGLVFTGNLHRSDGVTAKDDFGIWREKTSGGDSDKLLRTGDPAGAHTVKKLSLLTPVANATDQRRSFAPDGGVAAMAKFDDGSTGVVAVAADGSVSVPLESSAAVPDDTGSADADVRFTAFSPPATASAGRVALLAALKAVVRGQPAPAQAIFSNQGGTMRRVVARGDTVPGQNGARWGSLGQPAMGEGGMIGFIAALTGQGVKPPNRTVIARVENGDKTVVARLGNQAFGMADGVTFRRFMSMVVTDSDPARIVFTATVGGPGVNGSNNVGLWSHSVANGTNLLMRKGGEIKVGGETLSVRTFEALQAPKKNIGQGRSTDASGFVTAKAKLSDGRQGVLRIPLP